MELNDHLNRIYIMGRRPRIHFAGAVYHAMARGVDGRDIFIDDADRIEFMSRIRLLESNLGAKMLAHCLMNNHFHLALRIGAASLSSLMHRLSGHYSSWFNRRHERQGHLFQNRYKAILCVDERYLSRLIPYIHMNPVRAGFVKAPWDWPWSSFTGSAPLADDLSDFDPWPKEGTQEFELIRRAESGRISFESIAESLRIDTGFDSEALKARRYERSLIATRRKFVAESIRAGHNQRSIAHWLGSTRSAISRFAQKSGKWEA